MLNLQLLASRLRKKNVYAFAMPRAPLIDELKIPIVFYSDGIKTGVPSDEQTSLIAHYYKRLAAEVWVTGSRPNYQNAPNDKDAFENYFNSLFGIELQMLGEL